MRRTFDEFGFAPTVLPSADVHETNDEFVVELGVQCFEEKELGDRGNGSHTPRQSGAPGGEDRCRLELEGEEPLI